MSDEETFTLELKGLDKLLKALKGKPPSLKIGVMGSRNATIGAVHEFGAPARNIPQRSFLRIPLSENLNREMERAGLLDKDTLNEVIQSGSMTPWLKQVGVSAEAVVDDAFESEGPGWAPWRDPNYTNEGGSILTDTGQLRESVTSEVQE